MPATRRQARPSKYGNVPVVIDGIRFASKAEAKRWCELKLLERGKKITALIRQFRMPLIVGEQDICTYIADFFYHNNETGRLTVEDVKGFETEAFKIKWELAQALYGFDFRLITSKRASARAAA